MVNIARTNQSGSVASFLIVGIVLIALVAGGVYFVQKRDDSRTIPGPVAVVDKNKKESSAPSPSTSVKPSPVQTPKPSPSKSVVPTPKPTSTPVATPKSTPVTTQTLPTTGPTDNLASAAILALLVGVSIAYVQSLRARAEYIRQ